MRDRIRQEALAWIASEERGLASFEWACSHLSLNPVAVREALAKRGAEITKRLKGNQGRKRLQTVTTGGMTGTLVARHSLTHSKTFRQLVATSIPWKAIPLSAR